MIIRGGTGFWGAVRVYSRQNWAAIALVLTTGLLLAKIPVIEADFEATAFSAGIAVISCLMVQERREGLKNPLENEPTATPVTALCRAIATGLRGRLGERDTPPSNPPTASCYKD